MTVKQMNDALKEMRKVYNFKNDKTEIHLGDDCRCMIPRYVHLETTDEEHNVEIHMRKSILIEEKR